MIDAQTPAQTIARPRNPRRNKEMTLLNDRPEHELTHAPAGVSPASPLASLRMFARYKAWANGITYTAVRALPDGEALRPRQTRFGNMVHTLNHVYVIDDIFKAHLQGTKHGYTARNTKDTPPLEDLWRSVQAMDAWYIDYADALTEQDLGEMIHFEFVGGGDGAMTREEMLLHIVNHGTYHRGFVADMLFQAGAASPANDLPVFLRDAYRRS
jgi:uncharacterized damage-inducible protein DinB